MFKSKRLFANVVVFGTLFLLPMIPWYVPLVIAVWASWHFMYYEILILGALMDILFKSDLFFAVHGIAFPYPFLAAAAASLAILQVIKRKVRFYS